MHSYMHARVKSLCDVEICIDHALQAYKDILNYKGVLNNANELLFYGNLTCESNIAQNHIKQNE